MSLSTALIKANTVDVHYQAFMSELLKVSEFTDEAMAIPSAEEAVQRLHRPGNQYLNMNPYYVLLLEPGCSLDDVKARFRKMSLLVHPDKHGGDPRASAAFEVVRAAYDRMADADKLDLCNRVCEGARKRLMEQMKIARRAAKAAAGADAPPPSVPEDNPAEFRKALRQYVSKMFVEFEQRRKQLDERDEQERKRKADEAALEQEAQLRAKKEARAWEKSQTKRVAGWRAWAGGSGRGLKRPPPVKAEATESRDETFEERGVAWRRDWR